MAKRWMECSQSLPGNIYANCLLCASFRINKSRPLYIYTGNVQITPQGLGNIESSTGRHTHVFTVVAIVCVCLARRPPPPPPPASRRFLLLLFFSYPSTNYVGKKNLLDVSVAVKTHGRNTNKQSD